MIEPRGSLSINNQCKLLGLARSSYYYQSVPESSLNLEMMAEIDRKYIERPSYGSRKMTEHLRNLGYSVNRKRVVRLMQNMGIQAIVPKPKWKGEREQKHVYPYLLKDLEINRVNQVWGADITYVPVSGGYLYLVAVLDLFSRYVMSWRLSEDLTTMFCIEALTEAFQKAVPEIFNTDQGVQFTSHMFTKELENRKIAISMDGVGKFWDNIIVERLWRTIKYEEIYLKGYNTGKEAYENLNEFMTFYNEERLHQALDYRTPAEVYYAEKYAV